MRSPVLLLLFNRPETTVRVFEAVRGARPPRLYLAADGPRPDRPGEGALCAAARNVANMVDWPCTVKTLFRKRNLGCALGVSSAVTWFFSQEQEGIILEDDVLPHADFFTFCDELLEYYRDEPKVMHISGNNFQLGVRRGPAAWYFSRFAHVWGWAGWARAWKHFDLSMPGVSRYIEKGLEDTVREPGGVAFFKHNLLLVKHGVLDTWDVPWSYNIMRNGGLCVMPQGNMVRNIGFGGGTHCLDRSIWEFLPQSSLGPLRYPEVLAPDDEADDFTCRVAFAPDGQSLGNLVHEGMMRLASGQAGANGELLRVARSFYGDNAALDWLDVLTSAALGATEEAFRKAEAAARVWPEEFLPEIVDKRVRRALAAGKETRTRVASVLEDI